MRGSIGVSVVAALCLVGLGGLTELLLAQSAPVFPSTITVRSDSAGVHVSGRLVDSETGDGISGGTIYQGSDWAFISPEGEFSAMLPQGTEVTNLVVDRFGYRSIALSVLDGSSARFYMIGLDLTDCEAFGLPPGAADERVSITLSDRSTGEPINSQTWIYLRSLNSAEPIVTVRDPEDGLFHLPTVMPGVYHLTIQAIGYEVWTLDVLRLRSVTCYGVERLEMTVALNPR